MRNPALMFLFLFLVMVAFPLRINSSSLDNGNNTASSLVRSYVMNLFNCWKTVRRGQIMSAQEQEQCNETVGAKNSTKTLTATESISTASPRNGELSITMTSSNLLYHLFSCSNNSQKWSRNVVQREPCRAVCCAIQALQTLCLEQY